MKLGVGLVVKGGEQFIDKWIISAEQIADEIYVIDNGADKRVRDILISHPKVKYYSIQKNLERNQSRDYQQILLMARKENADWIWNIDIDEFIPFFNKKMLYNFLLNTRNESIGFPLFEMRENSEHYVMVKENNGEFKAARGVHKCYKNLSHLHFNMMDKHGKSIPHNCTAGDIINLPIHHHGHLTQELRNEKLKFYKEHADSEKTVIDFAETQAEWMKENPEKICKWGDIKEDFKIWM